jgi:hypothetical protein
MAIFLTHYAGWRSGGWLSLQVDKVIGEHGRAQAHARPDAGAD